MAIPLVLTRRLERRVDALDPYTVYGASWGKGESPTLTQTDAAVGMVANVGVDDQTVHNDFDNAGIYREIAEVTDTLDNVFIRFPKCYIRKTDDEGYKTWQISKYKHPGFYLPWCFWDFARNKELPYVDIGKYKASLGAGDKLESKPDKYPLVNKHIVDCRTFARNNNVDGLSGYQLLDIHAVDLLQTLFFIEFATLDSQAIMQGYTAGQYNDSHVAVVSEGNTNRIVVANAVAANYRVGQPISCGTARGSTSVFTNRAITAIEEYDASNKSLVFDGDPTNVTAGNVVWNSGWKNGFSSTIAASSGCIVANDGKYPCCYRGIESLWGDLWYFVDGVNINDHQAWVARNAEDYASNVFAAPYEQLSYANHNANGYIQEMGFDVGLPFAAFPIAITGTTSPTKYYCDYYYQATGRRIARVGGSWHPGSLAGISSWSLADSSSFVYVGLGGRLLKKAL